MTIILLISFSLAAAGVANAAHNPSVRDYAHRLVLARWHSEGEWRAIDAIVTPESGWNPCSAYPGIHDCGFSGSSSCGVPQANPCPSSWRGDLWSTRFAQVRWLVSYVSGRYGTPSAALSFRRAHGWY